MKHNVVRPDGVHVLAEMCATCIFRPGNLMGLRAGRLRGMVDDCLRDDGVIPCHATLDLNEQAICRGFFDRHSDRIWPLRFAIATDHIIFDQPPNEGA